MNKTTLFGCAALAAVVAGTVQHPSAYELKANKWNTTPVPFYVNTQNLDVAPERIVPAIEYGAYSWTNQTNAAFSFYYAGSTSSSTATNNARNEVFFRNASNGGAIATTYTYSSGGRTIDTDIVFWDGAYKFFTGSSGCSGGFYIEDVAAHEFGHALGLDHSAVSGASMYPSIGYCSTATRSLADDDKLGAEALYPSGPLNTAPQIAIASPSAGASFVDGASISFSGSASDSEEGNIGSRMWWVSDRDGQIGTGPTFLKVLSAGNHAITARVTDSSGASAEASVYVSVEAAAAVTQPDGISVRATGYKTKGVQRSDLAWGGATSPYVDIYRDGRRIITAPNDGGYTDNLNRKGSGTYSYVVCESGTNTCSAASVVVF